jgi:hypothetical protein
MIPKSRAAALSGGVSSVWLGGYNNFTDPLNSVEISMG